MMVHIAIRRVGTETMFTTSDHVGSVRSCLNVTETDVRRARPFWHTEVVEAPHPVPQGVMRIAVKDAIDVAGVVTTTGCIAVGYSLHCGGSGESSSSMTR